VLLQQQFVSCPEAPPDTAAAAAGMDIAGQSQRHLLRELLQPLLHARCLVHFQQHLQIQAVVLELQLLQQPALLLAQ
jgi:hypothetical protein